jgi:hypothetical protein
MRKALFVSLLLAIAACSVGDDSNKNSEGTIGGEIDRSKPTLPGVGDGEERASGGDDGIDDADGFAAGAPPPGAASEEDSAGGSAIGAGGAAGGSIGSGGAAASTSAPRESAESAGVSEPIDTDPVEPPRIAPTQPQQQRGLTAGAWDDNLNYERFTSFEAEVRQQRSWGVLPFTAADFELAHVFFKEARPKRAKLDVALVVDTTGSMGDEISYLQKEFIALSSAIEAAYPDAEQRWALVVYKDRGDVYVTRWFDFRAEPEVFREKLAEQSAGGGGDFPEAPEAAFEVMNQFAWRTADDVARLAFWVADAPHHDDKAEALAAALRTAQGLGVHVYPVASSGIDDFTELTMRSAAQLTGGRYLFLTNDSGLGGNHKEPSIPCYFVTSLRDAITRMVDIELSGVYREPEPGQILRTGGNPEDGACKLASGSTLTVF